MLFDTNSIAGVNAERRSGFTIIELAIVIAVIAIILAMVVPALMSSRKHANETAAIANLRTVSQAQLQYRTQYGSYAELEELSDVSLVDSGFSDAERQGYRFVSSGSQGSTTWAMLAEPVDPGVSGDRYFFIDESGVIRFREGEPADGGSPAVD